MFLIFICVDLLFLFVASASFIFKEEYKKYHNRMFIDVLDRPSQWGISRQVNHKIYHFFKWLFILATIALVIVGALCEGGIPFIYIVASAIIILPLGIVCGKYLCQVAVKNQCKKFKIPYTKI